jgi:hypothetical protein
VTLENDNSHLTNEEFIKAVEGGAPMEEEEDKEQADSNDLSG